MNLAESCIKSETRLNISQLPTRQKRKYNTYLCREMHSYVRDEMRLRVCHDPLYTSDSETSLVTCQEARLYRVCKNYRSLLLSSLE